MTTPAADDLGSRCEHAPTGRYVYGEVEDLGEFFTPEEEDALLESDDPWIVPTEGCFPESHPNDFSVFWSVLPGSDPDVCASLALGLPADHVWVEFEGGMMGGGWRVTCTEDYPPATHAQMKSTWPDWPYGE